MNKLNFLCTLLFNLTIHMNILLYYFVFDILYRRMPKDKTKSL